MSFGDPHLLAFGALAAPVAVMGWLRRRGGFGLPSAVAFGGIPATLRVRLVRLLPVLRVAAVLLFAAGLARPQIGEANAVVPAEGIDIALSIDISSSMSTSPFGGGGKTRLDVTKSVIRDFIKGRTNDRVGVVVFQKDALALAPPTLDYGALDTMVAKLDSGILPDGTGIGVGLATALNMLRESDAASRIVILLTDGEHNATSIKPLDAAELAAALRIRVYTIGLVSQPSVLGGSVAAGVDEKLLREMADETGGQYYAADNPKALASVYEEISKLETSKVGREHFEQFTELEPWFIGGAAFLLLVELAMRGTWLRSSPA
jgi:Ca-activated chloride channel family protein